MFIQLLIGAIIAAKLFNWITLGKCKSNNRVDGKTILITGANQGLGKELSKALAKRGGRIIMACRNLQKAEAARKEVVQASGNENVIVKKLDVSNFQSVRDFAKDFIETENRLDILIHNAGIYPGTYKDEQLRNDNGIEVAFATNHLGQFLLTHLLIDLMKRTGKARIIIHSSLFLFTTFEKFDKFDNEAHVKSSGINKYAVSKYANMLFVREMSKKLEGTGIVINCLHPGVIATNIIENVEFHYRIINTFLKNFFKNIEEGIETTLMLAVSDEAENVTGKYFQDCQAYNVSVTEKEHRNAKALWKLSAEMIGMTNEELIFGKN